MVTVENEQETNQEPPQEYEDFAGSEDLVKKAEEAAIRLEKANAQMEKLLAQQAQNKINETLGGQSSAGKQHKTAEELEKEDARRLLAGTGFEDMIQ